MAEAIVTIQGPVGSPQADALRALAPNAKYVAQDGAVGVVLGEGRHVSPFAAVMELVGADPELVAAGIERDLKRLDDHLMKRTFLVGKTLSATDRVVLGLLHAHLASLPDAELYKYVCVARWFDHIQFAVPNLARVPIKTKLPEGRLPKDDKKAKNAASGKQSATQISAVADAAYLDIRIGHVVQVEGHPQDADLYIEQIDLGEEGGPRQIVSGLAKFISASDMKGRYVCVLVNIDACEVKGVESSGLVLCASNAERTIVEPILPPSGVIAGERIMFPGVMVESAIVVVKAKRLHKLLKLLKTTDELEPCAVYADLPLMTNRGRVRSSPALRNCNIK